MWGIIVKNNGRWGFTAWVKGEDGNILTFRTKRDAEAEAKRLNANCSPVNNFNHYFIEKIEIKFPQNCY